MSKIGFVVAMEKEANLILNLSKINNEVSIAGKRVIEGQVFNKDFVMIISGIGKVNAGMSTQIIIDRYNVTRIINYGVAGGKKGSNLNAGDVVQVGKACQYDFDLSELDDVSIGYMQDYDTIYYPISINNDLKDKYPIVNCATGDRFTSQDIYLNIMHDLNAQIADMECGAIAQVCKTNNVIMHAIKLISDVDGSNISIYEQYASNTKDICDKLPNAIKELI